MKNIQRTFAALLLAAIPAFAADGIAFITNLKGDVAVDGNPRPVLLSELAKGQKVSVGKESQASVMFIASGKEYVLKGPNEFVVKETELSSSTGMPPLTRETQWRTSNKVLVQVAQTSAASVRMRSAAVAKPDTAAKLLYPTEGVVATLQPTFRWRAADPNAQGEFTLMIVGQEKPVHAAKAAGGSYRVPAKLKPETEYAWTVVSAGNEIGNGKFRTLSTEALAHVEKRKPSDKAEFSDRLLFTLMLQEMGAKQEAQESWARLAQERGDLPELAALAK